jgi:hypothetical protein
MRQWFCCNCHFDDEEDGHNKDQSKAQSTKIDRMLLTSDACLLFEYCELQCHNELVAHIQFE